MLLLLLKRVSLSKPVACGLARNRGQFALETNSACESGAGAGDLAAYEQIRFSVQGRKITIPYLEWSVVISRDNKQPSEGSVVLSNKQNFLCTGIRFCYLFFFFFLRCYLFARFLQHDKNSSARQARRRVAIRS